MTERGREVMQYLSRFGNLRSPQSPPRSDWMCDGSSGVSCASSRGCSASGSRRPSYTSALSGWRWPSRPSLTTAAVKEHTLQSAAPNAVAAASATALGSPSICTAATGRTGASSLAPWAKELRRQKAEQKHAAREAAVSNQRQNHFYEAQQKLRDENEELERLCSMIAEDGDRLQMLSEKYLQPTAVGRVQRVQDAHRRRWLPWRSTLVVRQDPHGCEGTSPRARGPIGPAVGKDVPEAVPLLPSSFLFKRHLAGCGTAALHRQASVAKGITVLLQEDEREELATRHHGHAATAQCTPRTAR